MADVVRFSVSLEGDLLQEFDKYCKDNRFETRSAAVRQVLRETLTARAWGDDEALAAATLTLVYDHHHTNISERLLEIQHHHSEMIVATSHVHLDHDNCLEVIFLRGKAGQLREVARQLRGLKGIRKGELVVAATADMP